MQEDLNVQGVVFDIERSAVHDGPGIRTTVFLKGCPLACAWCHNPESRGADPELLWSPVRCAGCMQCQVACAQGVHQFVEQRHLLERRRCIACGCCVSVCYAGALELAGQSMTVNDVLVEVMRDEPFYRRSGGGLTLSGGEPTAQFDFARALFREAGRRQLHTALDTAGFCSRECLDGLSPYVDLFLFDLKQMDGARHRALTGVSNERILDNLRRLDTTGREIWIRVPLIPTQNDDDANFQAIGRFVSTLKHVTRVEILPYHRLGESKYVRLGAECRMAGLKPPSRPGRIAPGDLVGV